MTNFKRKQIVHLLIFLSTLLLVVEGLRTLYPSILSANISLVDEFYISAAGKFSWAVAAVFFFVSMYFIKIIIQPFVVIENSRLYFIIIGILLFILKINLFTALICLFLSIVFILTGDEWKETIMDSKSVNSSGMENLSIDELYRLKSKNIITDEEFANILNNKFS